MLSGKKSTGVKKVKPVIVSMSSVAGSGGYYISMNADAIVAEPTTITGSIGVITGKIVIKGLTDWAGVGWGFIKKAKMQISFLNCKHLPRNRKK